MHGAFKLRINRRAEVSAQAPSRGWFADRRIPRLSNRCYADSRMEMRDVLEHLFARKDLTDTQACQTLEVILSPLMRSFEPSPPFLSCMVLRSITHIHHSCHGLHLHVGKFPWVPADEHLSSYRCSWTTLYPSRQQPFLCS